MLDDTQPQRPLIDPLAEEDSGLSGPGCLVFSLVGVMVVAIALIVIVLSATAGWTMGSQLARVTATAEMAAEINTQCDRIPNEIAAGNTVVLQARLEALAVLNPAPDCVNTYSPTATALFVQLQPTAPVATPSPEATIAAEATVDSAPAPETTVEPVVAGTAEPAGTAITDLDALLADARTQIATRDWPAAINTLDRIMALDPDYEPATVRTLMSQALNEYAFFLFNNGEPAEGIRITTRAENFGPLADGLEFERYAAELYLNAVRAIGLSYPEAIRRLRLVYDLGPGRYYNEVSGLLYEQHVLYGDALLAQGQACSAVSQYQNALNYNNGGVAVGKRNAANTACQNPTAAPAPGVDPNATPEEGVAPVGSRP